MKTHRHTHWLAVGFASAFCVGNPALGQLGNGTTTPVITFREQITGTLTFSALAMGERHSCGLTSTGEVWCWGEGNNGQLGNGARVNESTAVQVVQN